MWRFWYLQLSHNLESFVSKNVFGKMCCTSGYIKVHQRKETLLEKVVTAFLLTTQTLFPLIACKQDTNLFAIIIFGLCLEK